MISYFWRQKSNKTWNKKDVDDPIADVESENASSSTEEPFITVIDAFRTPRFVYNTEIEKYMKAPNQTLLGFKILKQQIN